MTNDISLPRDRVFFASPARKVPFPYAGRGLKTPQTQPRAVGEETSALATWKRGHQGPSQCSQSTQHPSGGGCFHAAGRGEGGALGSAFWEVYTIGRGSSLSTVTPWGGQRWHRRSRPRVPRPPSAQQNGVWAFTPSPPLGHCLVGSSLAELLREISCLV